MKLYSNRLTVNDLTRAATDAGRGLRDVRNHPPAEDPPVRLDIRLGQPGSRRRFNTGTHGGGDVGAASRDDWGHFLAALYELDFDLRVPSAGYVAGQFPRGHAARLRAGQPLPPVRNDLPDRWLWLRACAGLWGTITQEVHDHDRLQRSGHRSRFARYVAGFSLDGDYHNGWEDAMCGLILKARAVVATADIQAAAAQEQITLLDQAATVHRDNIEAEMRRYRDTLDHIENVYQLRLSGVRS